MSAGVRAGGRVARLTAAGVITLTDDAVPSPGPGEALIRLTACGVCGTDVHAYAGRPAALPIVLGHDAAGVVDALGPGTDSPAAIGERVTIDPTIACGACVYCTQSRPQLCLAGGYLGMTCDGTMASRIVVPARNLVPLPGTVTDVDATVLEPIAVALHVLERLGPWTAKPVARVVGGGPLGIIAAQTLNSYGWETLVFEPLGHRREAGRAAGLDVRDSNDAPAGDPADGPVLVVETSATAGGVALASRLATPGSAIAVVGRAPADFAAADVLGRELTVFGSRGGSGTYPRAVELVRDGHVRPAAVVSHHFGLDETGEAMRAVTEPGTTVLRAVLAC
ncbi:alcohol dehydrogenase catalytic domain-containing protein [Actinoplanes bogorensis]|uniref:Alcohol dehydrogenase catalytic domain-containing protein n=1 Tax=Paractinoplanes bogorensis TaxID=1610840 RepID=A0ABS5YXK9_9ACTN|nr:alcohol dehydrogenase catalytic domain-containing protein [Actinoplanes bogorensis]MBU2668173.1 alcohol dehydrogenase catalytic domain-containing protein [Actinoplanes bogorensis]